MAFTNEQPDLRVPPQWACVPDLRISFYYDGPSEVGKAIMGYRWRFGNYSLEWLYGRIRGYDANVAEHMAANGASAGCIVWATGFSIENDQFHWDIVRRKIAEFHDRSMHVIVYFSLTNCFWQEMFQTVPESEGWRQQGPDGEPVPYGGIDYDNRLVTRYLMCCNHPEWRAYQKRRIQAALEAGIDGIFWDNNFSRCHCPICQQKFRAFTKQRFGFECDIPRPMQAEPAPQQDLRSAREVVFDWVPLSHPDARAHLAKNLFRYHTIRDILEDLRVYAESIRPDIVWSSNGHLCQNIYDATNLLLSEDLDRVGYDAETDVLRTNAGVLRYLYEECGRPMPVIVNSRHMETFAYGCTGSGMGDPQVNAYLTEHAELYRDARSPARVGVVGAEMNYISRRSNWFDNLTRNHVLYDVLPVHRLAKFDLAGYEVILLRNIAFLSDDDCRRLREFVQAGGTLLATNSSSLFDETWARREDYGLADVFGVSAGDEGKPDRVENRFGKGLSIFYPGAAEVEIEAEPNGPTAARVVEDVKAHLRDPIVEVDAPPGVAVNVMHAAPGVVVHVMNYREGPAENVRLRLTAGGKLPRVVPFGDGSNKATDVSTSDGLAFTLPKVAQYTAVVVT